MKPELEDLRIRAVEPLLSPDELKKALPLPAEVAQFIAVSRAEIATIISGAKARFLAIVGPCSIHDHDQGIVYAKRLAELRHKVEDVMLVVMRVYFEKPRTTVGWKGFITDPYLDGSDNIAAGLRQGRSILLEIAKLGLPAATEFLDPIVPQYIADLVSWAAIGARTTESQTHREMASGLSMPVGFKNGTDGDYQSALDAMLSARSSHSFLGVSSSGSVSIIRTNGHPSTHVVLRGGRKRANCDPDTMREALAKMEKLGLTPSLLVDCSHANSSKQPLAQPQVWESILRFHLEQEPRVVGAMLESNLETGRQDLIPGQPLKPGLSITDSCLGWAETERLLLESAEQLRRKAKAKA
jgi:3-deoxy-7-phosphoheptulonate synthase